ncbi:MAG: pyridoxal-dependent decarboxylase, partial [Pseudomonadota bacterium]
AMRPDALRAAIKADREAGLNPAGIMICVGGTSIGAIDPVAEVIAIAREEGLYTHVDAAWAGSAMICPEYREHWAGVEGADSIVFNPHKWLGANFDCSIQFLKDPTEQVKTLGLRPSYLETDGADGIVNYSEWTVPLGRRFRALKLWFLLRAYGLEGLRERIRNHVGWTKDALDRLAAHPKLEIITDQRLALFTFAHVDGDAATEALLARINDDGRTYLTQTMHEGRYVIRLTLGQFDMTRDDLEVAITAIEELANG